MTATETPTIDSKIQDLCQAIVTDTAVQHARDQAEAFLADEASVSLYREVMNTGNRLDRRHRAGEEISDEEVAAYEELQAKSDANEGIRAFNNAQQVLQEVANKVNAYVMKTLEKGRVPAPEEIAAASSGGCCGGSGGGGCGC
ncbi:YlbF family regulator [Phragmitibacter flavus]|uniref:YlbF family regulator n=1 Tax=Phragmitibacter flavus TaxID=2576071 RepID=A0A5R8K8Y5_9BACT|nr:YlbF family regulator [Phragmitibacter flavus]TLD68792.1 YlbF family regulator [Phragmitibacter flavus]